MNNRYQIKLGEKLSTLSKFSKLNKLGVVTWIGLLITAAALFFRFYNYPNFLYFINDQGRDALKLQQLTQGHLTLVGPTTGLAGFFLGPLWYYLGVPGYWLGQGSPYIIALWYIGLASLALIPFWGLVRVGFPRQPSWQLIAFALLVLLPGSIHGSIFIWNPLLSLPLLAGALYALYRARHSRFWLGIAFLCLALILQAEFAYAIFLVPVWFVLIFWLRQKINLLDYALAAAVIGLTLVPQFLFELRHHFVMTAALTHSLLTKHATSLVEIWLTRPLELHQATAQLFFGSRTLGSWLLLLLLPLLIWGGLRAWRQRQFFWQIIALSSLLPYLGFLLWTGNEGNFFDYYLTPHFIPLTLLLCYSLAELPRLKLATKLILPLQISLVASLLTFSLVAISHEVIWPQNEAGIRVIRQIVEHSFEAMTRDRTQVAKTSGAEFRQRLLTFTPNFSTQQYDYMTWWLAKKTNQPLPITVATPEDELLYLIIEPDWWAAETRFLPWYENLTRERVRLAREKIGVLTLETWAHRDFVGANGFTPYQETSKDVWGW